VSVLRLSVILGILLQKFSFQAQHVLPPEMRHVVFFSIVFKCIASFSEESEMTDDLDEQSHTVMEAVFFH